MDHALRILIANFGKIGAVGQLTHLQPSDVDVWQSLVATSVVAEDSETMGVCPSESSASFRSLVSTLTVEQNGVRCSPEIT